MPTRRLPLVSGADYSSGPTGHSRGMANLAAEAGRLTGMSGMDVTTVRRAGLVHDLGRTGVSNTILDKPAPLTDAEFERIRAAAAQLMGALVAQGHGDLDNTLPPRCRNHLLPAGCDAPTAIPASSLVRPRAISIQTGARSHGDAWVPPGVRGVSGTHKFARGHRGGI
jgi:hypothetical protein